MTKQEMLHDAIDLALLVEEKGHHLFVRYSPHVQWIELDFVKGKWNHDTRFNGYHVYFDEVENYLTFKKSILNKIK